MGSVTETKKGCVDDLCKGFTTLKVCSLPGDIKCEPLRGVTNNDALLSKRNPDQDVLDKFHELSIGRESPIAAWIAKTKDQNGENTDKDLKGKSITLEKKTEEKTTVNSADDEQIHEGQTHLQNTTEELTESTPANTDDVVSINGKKKQPSQFTISSIDTGLRRESNHPELVYSTNGFGDEESGVAWGDTGSGSASGDTASRQETLSWLQMIRRQPIESEDSSESSVVALGVSKDRSSTRLAPYVVPNSPFTSGHDHISRRSHRSSQTGSDHGSVQMSSPAEQLVPERPASGQDLPSPLSDSPLVDAEHMADFTVGDAMDDAIELIAKMEAAESESSSSGATPLKEPVQNRTQTNENLQFTNCMPRGNMIPVSVGMIPLSVELEEFENKQSIKRKASANEKKSKAPDHPGGANYDIPDEEFLRIDPDTGNTVLMNFVMKNNPVDVLQCIKRLHRMNRIDDYINTQNNGKSPLYEAVLKNNPEIVEHLLRAGANPVLCEQLDNGRYTFPLFEAASHPGRYRVLCMFLQQPGKKYASRPLIDHDGNTLFSYALMGHRPFLSGTPQNNRAIIDRLKRFPEMKTLCKNLLNKTTLMEAAETADVVVFKALLDTDKDGQFINTQDQHGNSVMHVITQSRSIPLTQQIDMLTLLMERQADYKLLNNNDRAAFELAASLEVAKAAGSHLMKENLNIVRWLKDSPSLLQEFQAPATIQDVDAINRNTQQNVQLPRGSELQRCLFNEPFSLATTEDAELSHYGQFTETRQAEAEAAPPPDAGMFNPEQFQQVTTAGFSTLPTAPLFNTAMFAAGSAGIFWPPQLSSPTTAQPLPPQYPAAQIDMFGPSQHPCPAHTPLQFETYSATQPHAGLFDAPNEHAALFHTPNKHAALFQASNENAVLLDPPVSMTSAPLINSRLPPSFPDPSSQPFKFW